MMMTKYLLLLTCLLCSVWANAQTEQLLLMPYPQAVERQQGQLVLNKNLNFAIDGKQSARLNKILKDLGVRVKQQTGHKLRLKKTAVAKAQLIIRIEDIQPIANHI